MVVADAGITLIPTLATQPPVSPTQYMRLRRFAAPQPKREIGACWRRSSALGSFLREIAPLLGNLPDGILEPQLSAA